MKVLTTAEMREVDRRTMDLGISGAILMENAGSRVVDFLARRFRPLSRHGILIFCGKGNNGGDGLVIARQIHTRFRPRSLHVVLAEPLENSEPLRMLQATGFRAEHDIRPEMRSATLIVDALLGVGLAGPAHGRALDFIREINTGFPDAKVVAVDIPSGMASDSGASAGEIARADATVTFTAPKVAHFMPPNCDAIGDLRVVPIGSPPSLYDQVSLHATEPADFRHLLPARRPDSNKGDFGHVLVIAGAPGKVGAAEMTGLGALHAGAGLVTVACSEGRLGTLELMTESLPGDDAALAAINRGKDVIAIGPGLGRAQESVDLVHRVLRNSEQPVVIDADGLNALAGTDWKAAGRLRIVTPHPGEMSRLCGRPTEEVQARRLEVACGYAAERGVFVVLKGHRTVTALPDGRAWINPVDSPAMATGGTGDILTGMIAGFLAQFPDEPETAVLAAVYLHGLSGRLGARVIGDKTFVARDLLRFLPGAIERCARIPDTF